jgi:hypothetical protein
MCSTECTYFIIIIIIIIISSSSSSSSSIIIVLLLLFLPLFSPKSFVFPSHIKKPKIKIYKAVILSVVLYECETWSLTLREEHRLRVFENRVLRRIFGPKREEDGSWRKLHNDELHSLYSSPNIVRVIKSRRMRLVGHVARMGEVFRVFWLGGQKGREHWEDLDIGGRITLKWALGR